MSERSPQDGEIDEAKVRTDKEPRKEKTYEEIKNEGIVKVGLWSIASVCVGLFLKRTIFK